MKTWFENLSLSKKQLVSLISAGALPMLIVALLSFNVAKSQLEEQAFNQLESVRQIKAGAISRYAEQVESQIVTLASSTSTVHAMEDLAKDFDKLALSENLTEDKLESMRSSLSQYYTEQFAQEFSNRNEQSTVDTQPLYGKLSDTTTALQYHYISNNESPLGNKHLMDRAKGMSAYHFHHEEYHPNFRTFLNKFGFYDIFLVDVESGNIIYSVFKELDFATSLKTGPYSNTNFATAFRKATQVAEGEVVIEDYATYLPSYDAPASFAATPIVKYGKTIGVLIFQLPLEPINVIMGERSGMGETGESYLVGSDQLMRSDSYLDPVNHTVQASFKKPAKGKVDTDAVKRIFQGEEGNDIIIDYNGNPVLSSFAPVQFGPLSWGILAEIDEAEAFAGIKSLAWTLTGLFAVIVAVLFFAALYISKLISQPVVKLSQHIRRVQEQGDFSLNLNIPQKDEIGDTCRTFSQLQRNLSSGFKNVNEVLYQLGQGNCENRISENYPGDLGRLTDGVNQAAEQIQQAQAAQAKQAALAAEKAQEAEAAAERASQQAQETLIIKQALDVCDTSVMIADANLNINYFNEALKDLIGGRQAELQEALPNFNAAQLMGTNVDVFHKEPAHQRKLLAELKTTYRTSITVSGLTFNLAATPIFSNSGERLGTVIEWQDMTDQLAKEQEEKAIAAENLRIRQALDNSSTSTMIADNDYNIIYTNKSLTSLMTTAQPDLQKHLGQFDSRQLLGKNIDQFHRNPGHQRGILDKLNSNLVSEVEVGSRTLQITTNPIIDTEGQRVGMVVEWLDRTDEVAIEKEVADIISAASSGEFSKRIDMTGKKGFFERVSLGLNQIMENTHGAIGDLVTLFSSLSEGDLTKTMDREFSGDFARLQADANKTIVNLRDIVDRIQSSSGLITRAADEISSGTQDLSCRTEEQASSLEETASSIEEITQIVRKSEENATLANTMATNATEIARKGDKAVAQTSEAMQDIASASNKIANIIGVIDEIAFQTNLLALNAAVEAARAGEQGRGFAVVAGEVRNLAQRSASAAKEIKGLIDDSVSKVANGTELVQSSRRSLAEIVSEIEKVSHMMGEISTSAREQTAGIEQVNTAVTQMDQMTQQNAALVEQASAASAAMAEQAVSLNGMVQFFKR